MTIELDQTRIMIIYSSFMIIKWKYYDDHITYMRLNDCFSLFRKPKSYAHSNYTRKEIVGLKIVLHGREILFSIVSRTTNNTREELCLDGINLVFFRLLWLACCTDHKF